MSAESREQTLLLGGALPGNSLTDAFACDALLPAVRANGSLTKLRTGAIAWRYGPAADPDSCVLKRKRSWSAAQLPELCGARMLHRGSACWRAPLCAAAGAAAHAVPARCRNGATSTLGVE